MSHIDHRRLPAAAAGLLTACYTPAPDPAHRRSRRPGRSGGRCVPRRAGHRRCRRRSMVDGPSAATRRPGGHRGGRTRPSDRSPGQSERTGTDRHQAHPTARRGAQSPQQGIAGAPVHVLIPEDHDRVRLLQQPQAALGSQPHTGAGTHRPATSAHQGVPITAAAVVVEHMHRHRQVQQQPTVLHHGHHAMRWHWPKVTHHGLSRHCHASRLRPD